MLIKAGFFNKKYSYKSYIISISKTNIIEIFFILLKR